ncbi:putative MFS transporter, AGZA family, xanthine/uracil permease [Sporobacter termitidis DSM 10068]|uniref:Putative MFS transporter, AGZA family, xanthine/uracil permease n=1 Tax=Sporobacter termitidis DSM 10068 TaxID=1123282 RepID=A0A1M5VQ76_9FIRM|nr:NCS2 family permease [Sporobacter termitidis]SHH77392.1 putative MFS transporter, AGZA family, xanthine/uracil permease [Sporobacter termitidis DSM 10068]
MEKFFKIKQYGTNVRTELVAGITTFFTMAYIIFVNPNILSLAGTPDNPFSPQGIFVATIIASFVGTMVMALFANVPFALAPGMGMNAFFTFTICQIMGFTWQQALAMVLICGVINIIITTTGLRKAIIRSLPKVLQGAIGGGIGLFISYIGVKDAGFLKFTSDPGTYLFLGKTPADATVIANASAVPSLVNFSDPAVLLGLIGVLIIVTLMVRKVKGAILIGIVSVTAAALIAVAAGADPHIFFPLLPEDVTTAGAFFGTVSITPASIGSSIASIKDTAFKLDFAGLFSDPSRIVLAFTAIIAFILTDIFDALGCFVGIGRRTGIFDAEDEKLMYEGSGVKSRMDRALFADLCATITGAIVGTSNTTAYAESAVGIAEGGRTGLTSVTTAVLFLLSLVLAPVVGLVPSCATAPALIVVGILMMGSVMEIDWRNFEEAAIAFVTVALMPFTYSITTGIAFGFIFFVLIRLLRGRYKEIHPIMYGATALFIVNFVLLAVNHI